MCGDLMGEGGTRQLLAACRSVVQQEQDSEFDVRRRYLVVRHELRHSAPLLIRWSVRRRPQHQQSTTSRSPGMSLWLDACRALAGQGQSGVRTGLAGVEQINRRGKQQGHRGPRVLFGGRSGNQFLGAVCGVTKCQPIILHCSFENNAVTVLVEAFQKTIILSNRNV